MNIAIIPARGKSKRIKNKNSKLFFGKPIITYAIELALKSKIFEEVVVTSNDEKIIKISKKYGAKVLRRPDHLSKNSVPIIDVVSHAIKKINKLIEKKDLQAIKKFYPKFQSELMRIAKTGVVKRENASRKIARISKKIKKINK